MSVVTEMELKVAKFTISAIEDVGAGATTQTLGFHIPGGNDGYLIDVLARVTTAFVGVTNPTVKVGTADDSQILVQEQPLSVVGTLKASTSMRHQGFCEALVRPGGSAQNQDYQVVVESDSGNLSSLTAGEIEFIVLYAT